MNSGVQLRLLQGEEEAVGGDPALAQPGQNEQPIDEDQRASDEHHLPPDERDPHQVQLVLDASHDILDECIKLGGSVTGEHGIGVEKIDFMEKLFSPDDLSFMLRLRVAFNPDGRCSPGKMLPTAGGCAEPSSSVTQTKPGRRAAV